MFELEERLFPTSDENVEETFTQTKPALGKIYVYIL